MTADLSVLIAEDDASSRLLLQKVLEKWGYRAVAVADGERALAVLTGDEAPALAILDWMMPGLDGVEVCRRVRKLGLDDPPYLIILTSRADKQDVARALEAGADDYVLKPFDRDELRARLLVGRRFVQLNRSLLEAKAALERQAVTDPLTGILNRRGILDKLESEVARAERQGEPLSVALLDIDHFKAVNDRYGHAVGDEVLRAVVERTQAALRAYDSVGRFGGEEFLLVTPGLGAGEARAVLERVRLRVGATPVAVETELIPVTVSIGGAAYHGGSIDALIRAADDALYRVKAQGRDRTVVDTGSRLIGSAAEPAFTGQVPVAS
jgi:two-component system cell cycle response regulator